MEFGSGRSNVFCHLDAVLPCHGQLIAGSRAECHPRHGDRALDVVARRVAVGPGEDALLVVQSPNLDFSITSGRDEVL